MKPPVHRITPDNITKLGEYEIFVFGSNMSGRHGKGAAKQAMKWGAKYGQASGLMGRTYGIPTVNASITSKLPLEKIQGFVDRMILDATNDPDYTYLVTMIGCGLAGWGVKEIAPLFIPAISIENIHLPIKFWKEL